jgi:hypothetical protein
MHQFQHSHLAAITNMSQRDMRCAGLFVLLIACFPCAVFAQPEALDLRGIPPEIVATATNEYSASSDAQERGKLARIILSFSKLSELLELTKSQDESLAMLGKWGLATREMEADLIAEVRALQNKEEYQSKAPQILQRFVRDMGNGLGVDLPELVVRDLTTRIYTTDDYLIPTLDRQKAPGDRLPLIDAYDSPLVIIEQEEEDETVTVRLPRQDEIWKLESKVIPTDDGTETQYLVVGDRLVVATYTEDDWKLLCFRKGKPTPEWSMPCEPYLVAEMESVYIICYLVASKDEKSVAVFFLQFGGFSVNTYDMTTGRRRLTFHSRLPDPTDWEWLNDSSD